MNKLINQLYILHFVRRPFAPFLTTPWLCARRNSGPYQRKTVPSAISDPHHYRKFYHSDTFINFEINGNMMVQVQRYMGDLISLPNQI